MVDLTADELSWQGLSPESFMGLDLESRNFVTRRALFYRSIKDQTLVAELLEAMASELPDKKIIVNVLEGKNRRGVEAVRIIVRDFKKSGVQSIGEYYKSSYPGKAGQILLGVKEKPKVEFTSMVVEVKPEIKDAEYMITPPETKPRASFDERGYVASEISRWTNTPIERVLKLDKDLIDRIIEFAGENSDKGVDVKGVCRAVESMFQDKSLGVHFPLEVFFSHKDELLRRLRKDGQTV